MVKRRDFIKCVGLGLTSVCLTGTKIIADTVNCRSQRPNVVAIVTDDLAEWAMGAYGNPEVYTPKLDRIANEGILFSNSFVLTPVCSPSRATYMSGLYPTQHTITDFLDETENFDVMGFRSLTWPAVLQKHGYATALVGKWDLGLQPRFYPTRYGFDHFFGYLSDQPGKMNPKIEVSSDFTATPDSLGGGGRDFPRSAIKGKMQKFKGALPDVLTNNAMAFIKANKDKHFALLLHYQAPHGPHLPVPEQDLAHYRDLDPTVPDFEGADVKGFKKRTKEYYAATSAADRNVGRLMDFLDEQNLSENTLLMFTSDNGENIGQHRIMGKGNGRWIAGGIEGAPQVPNMWDTSIRVPLVMCWPGVIKPGSRAEHMISNLDIFRTVLGSLNVPVPKGKSIQGIDFSPLLRGRTVKQPDAIFGQYDLHNEAIGYLRMIRTKRWKYVHHFHTNFMHELYDLKKDPDENDNLINGDVPGRGSPRRGSIDPATFQQLKDQLNKWMQSIDDPLLKDPY